MYEILQQYSEYGPAAVVTLLFLIILPFGRKIWIQADTLITVIWGIVAVFFSKQFLNYQIDGHVDDISLHFYRLFGLILLSTSLFAFFGNLYDPAVQSTVLWSRTLGISLYIINRLYSYYNYDYKKTASKWNRQSLIFGVYGDCLWLLGNLIHALRLTDWGGVKETFTKLDLHIRLDFLCTLMFGLLFYIFPGHMVGFQVRGKLHAMHLSVIRIFSSFIMSSAVIAGRATNFEFIDDKIAHLTARILANAGIITAQLYIQYTTKNLWNVWHIYFGMVGMSIWSINSALGFSNGMAILNSKKKD